jgi:hypothetical protein
VFYKVKYVKYSLFIIKLILINVHGSIFEVEQGQAFFGGDERKGDSVAFKIHCA